MRAIQILQCVSPCCKKCSAGHIVLLVIGAQHRFFRGTTVMGTTTERLLRFSSCPVLVVPRRAVEAAKRIEPRRKLVSL